MDAAEEFQRHRPRLLGIAYRLLGSAWDAEDVVEEAVLRWFEADRFEIREPVAFLTTVVTRLALDHLKSARVQRESYYGPWLPEPVRTGDGQLGPMETVEQRESVSLATLRMMEQLTPPERAVFMLRTAFDVPYEEIATILEVTVASARQLMHRAQSRLSLSETRFQADPQEHAQLFASFLVATSTGDLAALEKLLADQVVVYSDGGGKVNAALRPIEGSAKAMRFITGLLTKFPVIASVNMLEANGFPAALMRFEGQPEKLIGIGVRDGQITDILVVMNPGKLTYLAKS